MKYVLVTGAAGGIGQAVVSSLSAAGYGILGLDLERALKTQQLSSQQGRLHYRAVDVTDPESMRELGRFLQTENYPLQGLVCCAGLVHRQSLLKTSFSSWKKLQAVNADGVFLALQLVAQIMIDQASLDPTNSRSLVVVSSNAGHTARSKFGAYGASKAAASQLAKSFGLELAAHGIRVNTICPGTTKTAMVTDSWEGQDKSQQLIRGSLQDYRLGIPLGRIAEPEDIAAVIEHLISPASRHMTMQTITVDGGASL